MNKKLKKCYSYLNLPYNANIDEVENNEKALIKILQTKSQKNSKRYDKKIKQVVDYSNEIIENINKFGIPKTKAKMRTPNENFVIVQLFIFIAFFILCVVSFVNLF